MFSFVHVVYCLLPGLIAMVVLPGYQPISEQNERLLSHGDYVENPEEVSGQFEGDIVLNEKQSEMINIALEKRKANVDLYDREINTRWKDNTVPYGFQGNDVFTLKQKKHMVENWKKIEKISESCIKFKHHTTEEDYILVTGDKHGCFSYVGQQGGQQILNLHPNEIDTGCMQNGTIIHESLHTLGFFHMHSAHNRDDYVKVMWDNIINDKYINFALIDSNVENNFGYDYDIYSVMHYSPYAFGKRVGLTTLQPLEKINKKQMGQRIGMTKTDIGKLFRMYNCTVDVDKIPVDEDGIIIIED